jgi:hypothetical protein
MRITRSKGYRFRLAEYESMEVMSSVTVESADDGVSVEELAAMSPEEMDTHIQNLESLCADTLQNQLKPLLEEARYLAEKKSSATDVESYNEGLNA